MLKFDNNDGIIRSYLYLIVGRYMIEKVLGFFE